MMYETTEVGMSDFSGRPLVHLSLALSVPDARSLIKELEAAPPEGPGAVLRSLISGMLKRTVEEDT